MLLIDYYTESDSKMGNFRGWRYIFKLGEAGAEGEHYLPR